MGHFQNRVPQGLLGHKEGVANEDYLTPFFNNSHMLLELVGISLNPGTSPSGTLRLEVVARTPAPPMNHLKRSQHQT